MKIMRNTLWLHAGVFDFFYDCEVGYWKVPHNALRRKENSNSIQTKTNEVIVLQE